MMQRSGLAVAALAALIAFAGMLVPSAASAGCINVYVPETTEVNPGTQISIPVTVSDVAQGVWPIYSFELEIEYCTGQDAMLTFTGASNGPMLDAAGWPSLTYFEWRAGGVKLANAGSIPLSGDGVLINLNFTVSAGAQPCDVCDLNIVSMVANDAAQAVDFCTDDGQIYVGADSRTGHIKYRDGDRPVPKVKVRLYADLNGSSYQRTTWTDANGDYHFTCLPKGLANARVVPSKSYDQDVETAVGTADASIILRRTVMNPNANAYFREGATLCGNAQDFEAADTAGDGDISAYDASLLLQFAVLARSHMPAWDGRDWIFCAEDSENMWNEGPTDTTDFTAILIGDVNRNWGRPELGKGVGGSVDVHLARGSVAEDGSVLLPIELGSGSAVSNGVLELRLPAGVNLVRATAGSGAHGALVAANQDGKTVRVAFARAANVENESGLVTLRLRSNSGDVEGAELVSASFEDGQVRGSIGQMNQTNLPASDTLRLMGNRPNPFNPQTSIRFYLPDRVKTSVYIYDQAGHRVRTLVNNEALSGDVSLVWNGTNDSGRSVASGVYYYQVKAGMWSSTAKMTLVK